MRHPAISLDQLAGAPGCFSGCARAKASIVESELAIWVKFENGAVSTEKNFARAAWLARQMSASVIASIATGGGVFQVRFEPGQRGRVPMLAPFDACRLIELEFVFQIFTHARHDQRVRIAGDDLCEPPHTHAAPGVAR